MQTISIEQKKLAVIQAVRRLIEVEGRYKGDELARILGISSSNVSNIKHQNKRSELIKLETWAYLYEQPVLNCAAKSVEIVETENLSTLVNACEDAKNRARVILVAAHTGYGKTTCLLHYTKSVSPKHTYYVRGTAAMTPLDLIRAIARGVKVNDEGKRLHELLVELTETLAKKENPLVIIDEASKLKPSTFIILQSLIDGTTGTGGECGFVMAGIEEFGKIIDRKANNNKVGFAEIKRRIGAKESLDAPTEQEIEKFCLHYGLVSTDEIKAAKHKYINSKLQDFGTLKEIIQNIIYTRA